LHFIWKCKRR